MMTTDLPETCSFDEAYTELDQMIRDLAREQGLLHGISPDIVGGDPDNHHYWGNGQEERHKASVEWRVKLFHELRARPEWVSAWRAARELDRRIEQMCEERWVAVRAARNPAWCTATDEIPEATSEFADCWEASRPLAIRLRRQLEAGSPRELIRISPV